MNCSKWKKDLKEPTKAMEIQEDKELTTLPIEELLGHLKVHEVKLKEEDFQQEGQIYFSQSYKENLI